MSSLLQEKLSEEVSKDHAAAENEPEVHVDNNQAEEDDRTKPLLERLKALEVKSPSVLRPFGTTWFFPPSSLFHCPAAIKIFS